MLVNSISKKRKLHASAATWDFRTVRIRTSTFCSVCRATFQDFVVNIFVGFMWCILFFVLRCNSPQGAVALPEQQVTSTLFSFKLPSKGKGWFDILNQGQWKNNLCGFIHFIYFSFSNTSSRTQESWDFSCRCIFSLWV